MKKRIALLAAATLVMSSLSGCASNSTAPETTATATTQAEKETTASDTQAGILAQTICQLMNTSRLHPGKLCHILLQETLKCQLSHGLHLSTYS